MTSVKRWIACLLGLAVFVLRPAPAASALAPVPEVLWISVSQDNRRIGFARGEYSVVGTQTYAFDYILVLHLPPDAPLAPAVNVGENSQWQFDASLRPLSFTRKTLIANNRQNVVNQDDGTFDWNKRLLKAHWRDFDQEDSKELEIPARVTSRFATNLMLAHIPLATGKSFSFNVFSVDRKAFMKQTFRVESVEKGRYQMELSSDETPQGPSTVLFEAASKQHPNGYTWSTTQINGQGKTVRLQAATREEALRGFEAEATSMGL